MIDEMYDIVDLFVADSDLSAADDEQVNEMDNETGDKLMENIDIIEKRCKKILEFCTRLKFNIKRS